MTVGGFFRGIRIGEIPRPFRHNHFRGVTLQDFMAAAFDEEEILSLADKFPHHLIPDKQDEDAILPIKIGDFGGNDVIYSPVII